MSSELSTIRTTAAQLMLAQTLAEPESILMARDFIAMLGELLVDAKRLYEQRLIDLLADEPSAGVNIGTLRFYLGKDRITKCKDQAATLAAVLEKTCGDVGQVAECMSSNAWKPGALRDVLGDLWPTCFEVIEREEVKEGKPNKAGRTLQIVDTKFLR